MILPIRTGDATDALRYVPFPIRLASSRYTRKAFAYDGVHEKVAPRRFSCSNPRIELRLTEVDIINTRRRSDAIHLQRIKRVTDLSYRAVCAVCSARCSAGGILAERLAGRPFLIRPSTGLRGRITPFNAPK